MSSKYVGLKFGKLTVIDSLIRYTAGGHPMQRLLVRCECGREYEREVSSVVNSKGTPMCKGCKRLDNAMRSNVGHRHPLYKVWWGMIVRCHEPNAQTFKDYGARGIQVCDRWRGERPNFELGTVDGFRAFVDDMGDRPSQRHSIDRVDNDGHYAPENCRWATKEEQANNTRSTVKVTVHGRTLSVSQWGRALGIGSTWATQARKHGVQLDKALEILLALDGSVRLDWYKVFGTQKPVAKPSVRRSGKENVKAFIRAYFDSVGWPSVDHSATTC